MEFSIGQTVILRKNKKWNSNGEMDHWINTTHVIREILPYHDEKVQYKFKGGGDNSNLHDSSNINSWTWTDDMMELIKPKIKVKLKLKLNK